MLRVKDTYRYLTIFIFAFSIPLSQYLSVRILLISVVLSLFFGFKKTLLSNLLFNSWEILAYSVVLILGLLYTTDLTQGLRVLETNFSVLVIPIIIACLQPTQKQLNNIWQSFILGVLTASVICFLFAINSFIQDKEYTHFFYYNLTDPIGFQPTYFAYYLSFGICLLLYTLYAKQLAMSRSVIVVGILFLFFMLMLTASRTVYIGMLFVLSFFILKYFFDETGKSNRNIALLSAFLLLVMLLINYFDLNGSLTVSPESTDYWERFTLWDAALRANPNPLLGVGTGDYKTALNQYYQSQGMELFANESYNSHNQFIQIYFSNGILGLLALGLLICRPLYLSFKVQNPQGILIIFPFIIYGVTEVFLGRFQGIVFFVFCHQLVITQYYIVKPKFLLNKENTLVFS